MPLIWQMSSGIPFSLIRYLRCFNPLFFFFANLPRRLFILCPKSKRCWLSLKSISQKILLKYCFSTVDPPNTNLIASLQDRAILLSSDCWNPARICSFLDTLLVLLRRPGEDIFEIYKRSSKCMPNPCHFFSLRVDHCPDIVTAH